MRTKREPELTDPDQVVAHLEEVLGHRDEREATALFVCCDARARPTACLHVVDCDPDASPSDCEIVLDRVVDAVVDGDADDGESGLGLHGDAVVAAVLIGLTRPGGEQVQPYDRSWLRAMHRVCHRRGIRALGVYVVTRAGVRGVHIDDAA